VRLRAPLFLPYFLLSVGGNFILNTRMIDGERSPMLGQEYFRERRIKTQSEVSATDPIISRDNVSVKPRSEVVTADHHHGPAWT
jgi:hypothetical protein